LACGLITALSCFPTSTAFNSLQFPLVIMHLPPELWSLIFRQATAVPRFFDTFLKEPLSDLLPPRHVQGFKDPDFIDSMRAKVCLVLVSRTWRFLATELLFEHLVIRDMATLRLILAVFAHRSSSFSDTEVLQSYGRCTKRIDLYIFTGFTTSGESLMTSVGPAAALVRQCINLIALAIALPEYLMRQVASSMDAAAVLRGIVEQSNAPSLRHFHLVYGRFSTPVTKSLLRFEKMEILTLHIRRGRMGLHSMKAYLFQTCTLYTSLVAERAISSTT
jgi:hypothetical protein